MFMISWPIWGYGLGGAGEGLRCLQGWKLIESACLRSQFSLHLNQKRCLQLAVEEYLCSQFAVVLCSSRGLYHTNLKRAANNIIDIITMGKVNLSFDQIAIFLVWLPMRGTFGASGHLEEPFPFPHHSFNLSCYPREPSMGFHLFLWDPLINSSF